ncbi:MULTISPECIES: hypothetical protein [Halorussus]|uniref:hypothetical protein n=1 Tax=Halorussus TaxID=1070314 RepID=UPI0020A13154|nr:hypothetical protein [Halorussus vallis]USZ78053.1 hypothetical protein NGM07_20535 [Halorussus vallis]
MNLREAVVPLAAAVVSFAVVTALVAELLREAVWPSLFVGIPAGLVGAAVAFVTTYRLRQR